MMRRIRADKRSACFVESILQRQISLYREAVTPQSPGLLQPWVTVAITIQPQRGYVTAQPVPG